MLPYIEVDLQENAECDCKLGGEIEAIRDYLKGSIISAYLSLDTTLEAYISACKRHKNKSLTRHYSRASRMGYKIRRFSPVKHCEQIAEINHSKPERSGGPMRGHYKWDAKTTCQHFKAYWPNRPMQCDLHGEYWLGAFHKRKLVAYIKVARIGDFCMYARILGHGDHLEHGVMFYLHSNVVGFLFHGEDWAKGLKHLIYAGYHQGTPGLVQWKRKAQFVPVRLKRR